MCRRTAPHRCTMPVLLPLNCCAPGTAHSVVIRPCSVRFRGRHQHSTTSIRIIVHSCTASCCCDPLPRIDYGCTLLQGCKPCMYTYLRERGMITVDAVVPDDWLSPYACTLHARPQAVHCNAIQQHLWYPIRKAAYFRHRTTYRVD